MSEVEVFDALRYRIEVDTSGNRCYRDAANQLHRIDGPAVERTDGSNVWYQNGRVHRTDGPAFEWCDGAGWWYLNGNLLTKTEFNQRVKDYV